MPVVLCNCLKRIEELLVKRSTYSVDLTNSAVGANKHHLVLYNTSTSQYVLDIHRITLTAEIAVKVTGFRISYRIHRVTSYSGGTTLTISKFDPSDPDLTGVVAVASPTSVTIDSTIDSFAVNLGETSNMNTFDRIYGAENTKPIRLPPGHGISIQQYGTADVGTLTAVVIFVI